MQEQPKNGNKNSNREFPVRKNDGIRTRNVMLVEDGQKPRLVPNYEAQELAKSRNLDLVEVGFQRVNGEPTSVAKILDYSRWVYQKKQQEKMAKKTARQNAVTTKELTFSLTCDDGDRTRKVKNARKFLEEGDKVKITIQLKGRQIAQKGMAKEQMMDMVNQLSDISVLEGTPNFATRDCFVVLRPNKKQNPQPAPHIPSSNKITITVSN